MKHGLDALDISILHHLEEDRELPSKAVMSLHGRNRREGADGHHVFAIANLAQFL